MVVTSEALRQCSGLAACRLKCLIITGESLLFSLDLKDVSDSSAVTVFGMTTTAK